jgi:hypothetical protein
MSGPASGLDVSQLSLPGIARYQSRENGRDQFEGQNYRTFADKALKMNPDINFSPDQMDEAFRFVVHQIRKTRGVKKLPEFDRMVTRVSGFFGACRNSWLTLLTIVS